MARPNCDFNENMGELKSLFESFRKNKRVRKEILDPDEAFYNLVKSEFRVPLELLGFDKAWGKGDIKGLKNRLDNLINAAENGSLGGRMASLFYNPEAFAKKDPSLANLLDQYLHISQWYKGTEAKHKNHRTNILKNLRADAVLKKHMKDDIISSGARIIRKVTMTDAEGKLNKVEEKMDGLRVEMHKGNKIAEVEYNKLTEEYDRLVTETELASNTELIYHVENNIPKLIDKKIKESEKDPKKKDLNWDKYYSGDKRPKDTFLTKEDLAVLTDKAGNRISGPMQNAVHEYMKLMDDAYFVMTNGVKTYIDMAIMDNKGHESKLDEIRDNMLKKLLPNKEKGFYPHFTKELNIDFMDGLMGRMEDLVLSSNKYFNTEMSFEKAMKNINGYIVGHTKSRNPETTMDDYSLNFQSVVDHYIRNVNRFNYINHINKATKDVLSKVESMYKVNDGKHGYGQAVTEFVQDLHKAATGFHEVQNPALNSYLRTILGFEFITKIGFNPRSAVRNASQSLLNLVEFGPIQMKEARDFFKSEDAAIDVTKVMAKNGLLFADTAPELIETLGTTPGSNTSIRYNEATGELKHVPMSKIDKIAGVTSAVAGKSGYMMAKVENMNRKMTFKIGYAKMFRMLNNPAYAEHLNKKRGRVLTSGEVAAARSKAAEDYAINMTIALHFDYNAFSKSKFLRSDVGKVVGQFQHFGFKFFERNMEYLSKAKNDILVGDFNGNNAWKAYRMSLIYFMAPAIASAVTGVDFGNVVEHDTADRMNKLWAGLAGDEEDKKQAFYGKGPVMGTIGFPIFSDIMNMGMLYDVINMDEDSLLALISGYQDSYDATGDERIRRTIELLHPFVGRTAFRHFPQLLKGNVGWALQSELGLYPTKEAKETQKSVKKLNPELFKALESLEQFGR